MVDPNSDKNQDGLRSIEASPHAYVEMTDISASKPMRNQPSAHDLVLNDQSATVAMDAKRENGYNSDNSEERDFRMAVNVEHRASLA